MKAPAGPGPAASGPAGPGGLSGPLSAFLAYLLWGFFPLYWKLMQALPAPAVLAARIVFALAFVGALVLLGRRRALLFTVLRQPRKLALLALAGLLVSANWGIYIWAVNARMIVETSLGYYINPLVNVALGVFLLRERLRPWQYLALGLGFAGVLIAGIEYGRLPWVALSLAFTFGFYSLIKKLIGVDALVALSVETTLSLPLAALCLVLVGWEAADPARIGAWGWPLAVLAGPVTAIPLILFGRAAGRIPLSMLGFIQYLTPSLTLLLGIFVFHEAFSAWQFLSFGCIWAALAVFSADQLAKARAGRPARGAPAAAREPAPRA